MKGCKILPFDITGESAKIFIPNSMKISPGIVLDIHRKLLENLNPRIAGKIRTVDVWVGNKKCMDSDDIELTLQAWCNSYALETTEEKIKIAHVKFEKMHPFEDGNGRTGRILMNLQRLKYGLPVLVIHEGDEQMAYYKWFREGKE